MEDESGADSHNDSAGANSNPPFKIFKLKRKKFPNDLIDYHKQVAGVPEKLRLPFDSVARLLEMLAIQPLDIHNSL